MIHIQGDGGHAKVVREIFRCSPSLFHYMDEFAIVAVGDNASRKKEAEHLANKFTFVTAIHPRAVVAEGVEIGSGTVVCEGAILQSGVKVGMHVIINAGAVVTHDCTIEDFAHIAPGVHLCGGVHVGEGALVGVGSCAVPGAKIPAWSLVKAGSVVK